MMRSRLALEKRVIGSGSLTHHQPLLPSQGLVPSLPSVSLQLYSYLRRRSLVLLPLFRFFCSRFTSVSMHPLDERYLFLEILILERQPLHLEQVVDAQAEVH